jgi:hypothetical protein
MRACQVGPDGSSQFGRSVAHLGRRAGHCQQARPAAATDSPKGFLADVPDDPTYLKPKWEPLFIDAEVTALARHANANVTRTVYAD